MSELRATYRLQMGPEMTFEHARRLVPYFKALGVTHLYLSPSLQARSGSTHGYDVVDPSSVSELLGGEDGLRRLRAEGLPIILDIVPNHMGNGDENRFWADPELREQFFDVDPVSGRHRRFFDIDDLAAIKVEDPEVFAATHDKVLALVEEGILDGVRVDHPDGLTDPAGYLERLRDGIGAAAGIWVEKILHPGEQLRDWPVDGTVGYEFLNDVLGVFMDPDAEGPLTELYQQTTGETRTFEQVALEAQVQQAESSFAGEVERLRRAGDFAGLEHALAAVPIYRTYVEPWSGKVTAEDREAIAAIPDEDLRRVLTLEQRGFDEFVTRFQQTSPPITAKGIEDTTFYRYLRWVALNEVGGDPSRWHLPVADFHAANIERERRFPRNLLITQTHDTKRSADVRARLAALSRMPDRWAQARVDLAAACAPIAEGDALDAELLFQTLVGVWPISEERFCGYVEKALREAKRSTNWVSPDEDYERRMQGFARALLVHEPALEVVRALLDDLRKPAEQVSLGMVLLKCTVPGTTDVYQGDELWDFSLVDPDNRRPVDWDERRDALAAFEAGEAPGLATMKLWVLWRALNARVSGAYAALEAGEDAVAFTRGDRFLVVVDVRGGSAGSVALPAGSWRAVLDHGDGTVQGGRTLSVRELVGDLGCALLERTDG